MEITNWRFARLIAIQETAQPAEFKVADEVCMIGRSRSCHIVVKDQIVSRLHATIERDEVDRYILHDRNSANGTFINGESKPLQSPYRLQNGDEIGLGIPEPVLRFEDEEATARVNTTRLTFNEQLQCFVLDQTTLELTPNQFRLMEHLYQHAYDLCTRESCAEALWGTGYDPVLDDQALDRTVSNLRKQLRQIASDADFIITRRGVGYILSLNS